MDSVLEERGIRPTPLSELRLVRDAKGEVEPIMIVTPAEMSVVKILPLTYADSQRMRSQHKLRLDDGLDKFPLKLKHQLIVDHILFWEPDPKDPEDTDKGDWVKLEITAADIVNEFAWTTIDDLVAGLLQNSRDIFRRALLTDTSKGKNGKKPRATTKKA